MTTRIPLLTILMYSIIIGSIAGALFIFIQPMFGMDSITSRHAQAYVEQGGYSATAAFIFAWIIHTMVSVAYAAVSIAIFYMNKSLLVSIVQVALLGWLTTLIATPANVFVVKTMVNAQLPALSELPAINTSLGAKLNLHILFFSLVLGAMYIVDSLLTLKRQEAFN